MRRLTPGRDPEYVPPIKPYSFLTMLDDILVFAAETLVDGGRLAFWMPTANDEALELVVPTHPCLETVEICTQVFNKCPFARPSSRTGTAADVSRVPKAHRVPPHPRRAGGPAGPGRGALQGAADRGAKRGRTEPFSAGVFHQVRIARVSGARLRLQPCTASWPSRSADQKKKENVLSQLHAPRMSLHPGSLRTDARLAASAASKGRLVLPTAAPNASVLRQGKRSVSRSLRDDSCTLGLLDVPPGPATADASPEFHRPKTSPVLDVFELQLLESADGQLVAGRRTRPGCPTSRSWSGNISRSLVPPPG